MTKDIKISKVAEFNYYSMGLTVLLSGQRSQVHNKIKAYVTCKLFCKIYLFFWFFSQIVNNVVISVFHIIFILLTIMT